MDSLIIEAILAFGSTFFGVIVAFEFEAFRDRRRQQREEKIDSIAILKALQDDMEKNLKLAEETSSLSVQTIPVKPVDYKNVDPSFWRKLQIKRLYKLGLDEEIRAATTFYYILEAFYREAQDFLAWQNSALTMGRCLTAEEAKRMYLLKAGMIYKNKYLHDTFGSLPGKIQEKIRSLEHPSSSVSQAGNESSPLTSKRDEIRNLGWLSIGLSLTYATNFLPTTRAMLLIGFFAVAGILFMVRKDRWFGLTLIGFGVGLIASYTDAFLSAVCCLAFLALGLVILSWPVRAPPKIVD